MKISWWQGGLHIEPESAEDTAALMRLWNAERVQPSSSASQPDSTGVIGVKFLNVSIGNQ
jgi:hypothetical protein